MAVNIVLLAAGIALLLKGAGWLVRGSSDAARRIGVSELAIGLTVVAFGTSLPELSVSITSTLQESTDLAVGNVVGSNITNILLILGATAVFAPIQIRTSTAWKEIPFAFLASAVLFVMANDELIDGSPFSALTRGDGIAFLGFFMIFLWYTVGMKPRVREAETGEKPRGTLFEAIGLVAVGVIALVAGGKLAVESASSIARVAGISEALIGLTIIAVGTSLPELVTSIVAARRGNPEIAVGNIVGSNIFNVFWILGVTSVIRPLPFSTAFAFDMIVAMAATVLLFFVIHNGGLHRRLLLFWQQQEGHCIRRLEGALMLCIYALYIVVILWRG